MVIVCKPHKKTIDNVILGAVVWTVIAQGIHILEAFLTKSYYISAEYFSVWSRLMMPAPAAPPAEFFYVSIAFNFMIGVIMTLFYLIVSCCIYGPSKIFKGLLFGWLVFLVSVVPGTLTLVLMINLPLELIAVWGLSGLAISLAGGVAIAHAVR